MITTKGVNMNNEIEIKPSRIICHCDSIEVIANEVLTYVSKGGLKLKKAIDEFGLKFTGKRVLDLGASTGGFTHCALIEGAEFVYAIDVGTDQLDPSLLISPKVKSFQNVHIRNVNLSHCDSQKVDIIVADLSFISALKYLNYFPPLLAPDGFVILLIKPQFEVGKLHLNKSGVAKNLNQHIAIILKILNFGSSLGLFMNKICKSHRIDSTKNQEYLALFSFNGNTVKLSEIEDLLLVGA